MKKSQKLAINFALWGGVLGAGFNLLRQLREREDSSGQSINLRDVFRSGIKGSLIGGVSGFAYGAYLDHKNQTEVPQDMNAFLHKVFNHVSLQPENLKYRKLSARANWLSDQIQKRYGSKLATPPTPGGSTCDGTALKNSFDIDIYLSFAQKSFPSTRAMFEDLLAFLDQLEGRSGIVDIRDQKKSIGVFINIGGKSHKIDVVPKKRSRSGKKATSGYLFVNTPTFFGDAST